MVKIRKFLEEEISIQEVKNLYDEYNSKYFGNILPDDCKIYYSKLAQRNLGKARIVFPSQERSIMLSHSISNSLETIRSVLAHEMIHIWQYTMDVQEGSRKYSAPSFADILLKSKDKGHNKYFLEWMKKLNHEGFSVNVTQDDLLDVEMDRPCFVIYITSGDYHSILWDFQPINIELVVAQFKDRFFEEVTSVEYFQTNDENILIFPRLSKLGIRKNYKNIFTKPDVAKIILDHAGKVFTTKDFTDETPDGFGSEQLELKNKVQAVLLSMHRYAAKVDFLGSYGYLVNIMLNVNPALKRIPNRDLIPTILKETPEQIINLIRNDWMKVALKDLVKGLSKGTEVSDLVRNLIGKNTPGNLSNLSYTFANKGIYARTSSEESYEVLYLAAVEEVKKIAKKYPHFLYGTADKATLILSKASEIVQKLIAPHEHEIKDFLKNERERYEAKSKS